ncbi:hypothetical protein [Streptomyces goshikiensis]|uniref:hypothetical protein n=1 Tax=Streptomyces goshikiensis TaxID=1942 RepID=UPI00367C023C
MTGPTGQRSTAPIRVGAGPGTEPYEVVVGRGVLADRDGLHRLIGPRARTHPHRTSPQENRNRQ